MSNANPVVFVVDDDVSVRKSLQLLMGSEGWQTHTFASAKEFLSSPRAPVPSCLVLDVTLPDINGLELQRRVAVDRTDMPIIFISGYGDVPTTVRAMKAGAVDFLEKPVRPEELLAGLERALGQARDGAKMSASRDAAATQVASLTTRQRQILDLVLAGHPSKNIAADLGISQRTVDNHRAAIMKKTGSKSVPALIRTALAAA